MTRRSAAPRLDARTIVLTMLAMVSFAANSLLCRLALAAGTIDPASFTLIRIFSGAVTLAIILALSRSGEKRQSSWLGAAALALYAAAFSYGYVALTAGIGAFLLFGAVQITMVWSGFLQGDRLGRVQICGFLLALIGLAALALRDGFAFNAVGTVLMILSGVAWGIYSLLGRGASHPLAATSGNFLRALPFAAVVFGLGAWSGDLTVTPAGWIYALLSGAVASGMGYAIWYAALPGLTPAQGASVQLSVPVITALVGAILLGEDITLQLMVSGCAILAGIFLIISGRRQLP